MFKQGTERAAAARLVFENSPENWQNGFPVGNGNFGGVVYQPEESIMEIAFTRHDHWKNHLKPWKRLTLDELRQIDREAPETMEKRLAEERRGVIEPCFKPGGRLKIWQDEFGGAPASPFFNRSQTLDVEHGEVTGNYEVSCKGMNRTTIAVQDCDVIATHVQDSYLHELQVGTYLPFTQRIELYRLYDPHAIIHEAAVTEDGIGYMEISFGEEMHSIIAFKVVGVPWHTPVVLGSSVSMEIDLDYVNAPTPMSYTVYQTMLVHEDGSPGLLEEAREVLTRCEQKGFAALQQENRAVWAKFWQQSGITLGNSALEALWYNNLYQYGCQSRGDIAPALFGFWNAERSAPWAGRYTGDINVAMYCWPLAALNHPEMLEGMFRTMERWLPAISEETRRTYGVDGLRFPMGCGLWGEETAPSMYRLVACPTGFYMDFYRKVAAYYPDEKVLRERIFPVMEKAVRFYNAFAVRDESNQWHYGPGWAPEQGVVPAWDVNNDLGLIKPLYEAFIEMDKKLHANSPDAVKAAEILAEFPSYPQANGEFLDSGSCTGRTELCHPGYLACIVPGDDVDADSDLAEVAIRTCRGHLEHTCRKPLAGKIGSGCDLTWGWLFAASVRLRDKEYANTVLKDIALADFVKSNGMFAYIGGRVLSSLAAKRAAFEVKGTQPHSLSSQSACVRGRDYTMTMVQQGGALLFGLMETMLQSHKREIKLFPCVLDIMGEKVSFHDLRAEGGLTVSGSWEKGKTVGFRIVCGDLPYHGTLRLFDSAAPQELHTVSGRVLKNSGNGVYELDLAAGEMLEYGTVESAAAVDPTVIKSYADDIVFEYGKRGTYY